MGLLTDLLGGNATYPRLVHIPYTMPVSDRFDAGAGAQVVTQNNAYHHGGWIRNGNAVDSWYEWEFVAAAGTYTIGWASYQATSRAIATFSIDGTDIGTIDCYDVSSGAFYDASTLTGITIASSGVHTIRLTAATRNASATAWYIETSALDLIRTGS